MLNKFSPSKICADFLLLNSQLKYAPLNSESYEDLYGEFTNANFIQFIKDRAEKQKEELIQAVTSKY